jgi:mono/diheme cytochrome c family protein
MTPFAKVTVAVAVLAGSMALCASAPAPRPRDPGAQPYDGALLYRTHCASCHGATGEGDGAVAPYLRIPPADLTRIAARNRGVFPADRVRRVIDGRQAVRGHGTGDMPVWGAIFGRSPILPDEAAVDRALSALVDHLASLQPRPAE